MRKRWLILLLCASLLNLPSMAYAKKHKPTLAQIEAAKKVETEKKKVADAATAKLASANQTLRTLTAKANTARTLYLKARKELAIATAQAIAAAKHAQATAAAVSAAHRTIGQLAANAYIMGGGMSDIQPLLSANGPQDLVDQLSTLSTLGSKNSLALERYKAAEVIAKAAKESADEAKAAQQRATDKVAAAKKVADEAKSEQQVEVDKLEKVQDQLRRDLNSAKRVRITLEQKRQLALLEESQSNQAAKTPGQPRIWKYDGTPGRTTYRASESQRATAVAFAKKQVLAGKPYVWGDEGPNSFDCSGLVYAAYKSAGLGWPNWDRLNSSLYYSYTKHVPLSELIPGDLIFYSYNGTAAKIHHMSIYAGDGMVWEARSTKSGLKYSSMYSVPGMMPFGGRI